MIERACDHANEVLGRLLTSRDEDAAIILERGLASLGGEPDLRSSVRCCSLFSERTCALHGPARLR